MIHLRLNIKTGNRFLYGPYVNDDFMNYCIDNDISYKLVRYKIHDYSGFNGLYISNSRAIHTDDLPDEQILEAIFTMEIDTISEYKHDVTARIELLNDMKKSMTPRKHLNLFFRMTEFWHMLIPGMIVGWFLFSLIISSFMLILIPVIWITSKIRLDWIDTNEQISCEITELNKTNENL